MRLTVSSQVRPRTVSLASSASSSRACPSLTTPRPRCSPAKQRARGVKAPTTGALWQSETAKGTRAALRRRYLKMDTATVAGSPRQRGHHDQGLASSFQPYPANAGKMAGWAYTIRGQMMPHASAGDPDTRCRRWTVSARANSAYGRATARESVTSAN